MLGCGRRGGQAGDRGVSCATGRGKLTVPEAFNCSRELGIVMELEL